MADNIFQIENTVLLAGPDGLFDRVKDHRCGHRWCDPPAQDPPGVGIEYEGYVGKPWGGSLGNPLHRWVGLCAQRVGRR
jgi:hypothetical protein